MRAKEFLREVKLDIPDQMVSVQIPLSAITGRNAIPDNDDEVVINPGLRSGQDGNYKWSPPLQQQLDVTKDAVGPSNNELSADAALAVHNADQDPQGDPEPSDQLSGTPADSVGQLKKRIAALLACKPFMLA
jgi:hypothetical protein